jgi:hypothetical protein
MQCYASLEQAERVAHGREPRGLRRPGHPGRAARASTVISIDYGQGNFAGNTLTWTVPNPSGCNRGNSYSAASMPSGWNDRVSSSKSQNGCSRNDHFQNTNFLGAGITCTCATMGTMNNQTSSELWSQ